MSKKKKLDDLDKELDLFSLQETEDIDLYTEANAEDKMDFIERNEEQLKDMGASDEMIANSKKSIEEQLRLSRERIMRLKDLSNEMRGPQVNDRIGEGIITEHVKHPSGLNQLTVTPDPIKTEDAETTATLLIPAGMGDKLAEVPFVGMEYKGLIPKDTPEFAKSFIESPLANYGEALVKSHRELAKNPQKAFEHYEEVKQKAYCGVDPGKSGAIAVMDFKGEIVHRFIMPNIGDDIDIHELYKAFTALKSEFTLTLVLEDVHSIFNSSAGSNFTFGFVCGAIEAIVISHSIKLIKVQPKTWQKEIWQNADKCYKPKKPEQKNPSIDTKATSLKAAKRMFPEFDFRKPNSIRSVNAHDGIVDAVLICEYARRKNL